MMRSLKLMDKQTNKQGPPPDPTCTSSRVLPPLPTTGGSQWSFSFVHGKTHEACALEHVCVFFIGAASRVSAEPQPRA